MLDHLILGSAKVHVSSKDNSKPARLRFLGKSTAESGTRNRWQPAVAPVGYSLGLAAEGQLQGYSVASLHVQYFSAPHRKRASQS